MDRKAGSEGSESRFASYVEHIASTLGHADRRTPFRSYCAGLILPGDRKSVEPIAARIEPSRVQGAHQSLHHFVANADWSQEDLLRRLEPCPSCHREERQDKRLDCRRHGISQEGRSFGGSPGGIAVSLASRTIVRSLSRCRPPTSMQACRSPFGSIFLRIGRPTRFAGQEPAFPRTLCSIPNRKSPSTRRGSHGERGQQ